ncbi:hypothetical protein J2128_001115 [Methanomicrobium sp. W14]|uniref:transglutaminase domain-containing protein n=1 Tax=Methanomicrobium sp. W14 TaxID=2817839 RepID=UPI001AE1F16C|nr:hypothetical protein [Methanomicrobium sp. W14]MBP2133194.1 hypothetical protein [Methanomicrobium sp. W14]
MAKISVLLSFVSFFAVLLLFVPVICPVNAGEVFGYSQNTYSDELSDDYENAMDYENPLVVSFAQLHISSEHSGNYSISQACDIWDYTNDNWARINDPRGPDYISSCSGTIKSNLRGDCDDYSVFAASLIEALGGKCRIVAAEGDNAGHTYPELYIGSNESEVLDACKYVAERYGCKMVWYSYSEESGEFSYWLNMDWVVPKYYGVKYYIYGDTSVDVEAYHPGRVYFDSDSLTNFYPGGEWDTGYPEFGYYIRTIYGIESLNDS